MPPRPPSRSFRDVLVWQKARKWAVAVCKYTLGFPKHEQYEMGAQLRDAAVSVPNNFAEGFKRRTVHDKRRSYNISQSSLEESRCQLLLSGDLRYGNPTKLLADAEEIARMLEAYVASMWRRARPKRPTYHVVPTTRY